MRVKYDRQFDEQDPNIAIHIRKFSTTWRHRFQHHRIWAELIGNIFFVELFNRSNWQEEVRSLIALFVAFDKTAKQMDQWFDQSTGKYYLMLDDHASVCLFLRTSRAVSLVHLDQWSTEFPKKWTDFFTIYFRSEQIKAMRHQ